MYLDEIDSKLKLIVGKNKVLVTGVFDGLHRAHLEFLKKAKAAGDILIVGLESDVRVKQIKGPDRPINNQNKRLSDLLNTEIADLVFILPTQFSTKEDHVALIKKINPKILAVSSHTKHLEAKRKILQTFGGDVQIVMEHDPTISTTLLQNQQKKFKTQVVKGFGRGKYLGYPTINMEIPSNLTEAEGIYAGFVWIDNKKYFGAFHYGSVPTFDQPKISLEVFVLDTKLNQVPDEVEFSLVKLLREIKKFDTSEALVEQIKADIEQARVILSEYDK